MKKNLLFIAMALMSASMVFGQSKVGIKVKGSDTCLPLSQREAENYMKSNKNYSVSVVGGGSGVGFSALIDGTTDIAQASRSIKMSEKLKMQEAGRAYKQIVIAYDALAIVVNLHNSVSQLTRQQLEGIFTGKITNWKQVGGENMKIIVYSRESSSGTFDFVKEHIMKNKNYTSSALMMPATGAIIQSVSQTKGAIGYVGLAYVNKEVKALKVSYDGKNFVTPSLATAKNKTYPVVRPLFYYVNVKSYNKVKPYVDFVLSPAGQHIVHQIGYVPL